MTNSSNTQAAVPNNGFLTGSVTNTDWAAGSVMAAYAHLMQALGSNAVLMTQNLSSWQQLAIKSGFQSGHDAMVMGWIQGGESFAAAGASGVAAYKMGGLMKEQGALYKEFYGNPEFRPAPDLNANENPVKPDGVGKITWENERLEADIKKQAQLEGRQRPPVNGEGWGAERLDGGRLDRGEQLQAKQPDKSIHERKREDFQAEHEHRKDELQGKMNQYKTLSDTATALAKALSQPTLGYTQMDQKGSDTVNSIANQNVNSMAQAIQALASLAGEATSSIRDIKGAAQAVSSRV